jgi:hypothetical protein
VAKRPRIRTERIDADVAVPQRVERWGALAGRWTFSGPKAIFRGPEETALPFPIGLAVGAPSFRDGCLRTRLKLSRNSRTTAGLVVGYTSIAASYVAAQIGAFERAYAVSEYRPNVGWEALVSAGRLENVDPLVEHELLLRLQGQSLSMTVDSVNVLNVLLRQPLDGQGMGLFAWDDGEVIFEETFIETTRPRVFVIMPFAEPFDSLYRDVIKPVADDQLGFEIVRVDEIQAPGLILEDIQRQIAASHAVIAEISTRNPNVFYELGYAHALRKPAILLVRRQDSGEVPFDLKGYRAIHYDDSIGGKKVVERNLRAHLDAVKRGVLSEAIAG